MPQILMRQVEPQGWSVTALGQLRLMVAFAATTSIQPSTMWSPSCPSSSLLCSPESHTCTSSARQVPLGAILPRLLLSNLNHLVEQKNTDFLLFD